MEKVHYIVIEKTISCRGIPLTATPEHDASLVSKIVCVPVRETDDYCVAPLFPKSINEARCIAALVLGESIDGTLLCGGKELFRFDQRQAQELALLLHQHAPYLHKDPFSDQRSLVRRVARDLQVAAPRTRRNAMTNLASIAAVFAGTSTHEIVSTAFRYYGTSVHWAPRLTFDVLYAGTDPRQAQASARGRLFTNL